MQTACRDGDTHGARKKGFRIWPDDRQLVQPILPILAHRKMARRPVQLLTNHQSKQTCFATWLTLAPDVRVRLSDRRACESSFITSESPASIVMPGFETILCVQQCSWILLLSIPYRRVGLLEAAVFKPLGRCYESLRCLGDRAIMQP